MKFFMPLIIIILIIELSLCDNTKAEQKELKKFENKAKTLACSFLSNSFINLAKDYDNKLKEILQQNKIIQNELEAKEKISQFMMANCYLKITGEIANKIILDITSKNIDLKKNKQYLGLFEMDKNTDFTKIEETMKEINKIMKVIKAEEDIFAKRRKEDPNFEKNLKDFEEKMKKNYEHKKSEKIKNNNNNSKYTKKKKGNGKKPYEGTKWEIVQSSDEKIVNIKDIIINPKKIFEVTGLNTFCGMIIMTLIFINIYQIIYNFKNKKEDKKENNNTINQDDINEINKEDNEEDEEEEKEEENNINKDNNINKNVEKEKQDNINNIDY